MRELDFRRWGQAALAVGMLLGAGCRGMPQTGGREPGEYQGNMFGQRGHQPEALRNIEGQEPPHEKLAPWTMSADRGFNGTIKQIGSSIDPRTPQASGKQDNSILDNAGHMFQDLYGAMGGASYSPTAHGLGGEDGAAQDKMLYRAPHAGFAPLGWLDRNKVHRR